MHSPNFHSFARYLPSKKFIFVIGGAGLLVVIMLLVSNVFGTTHIFNPKPPVSAHGTLSDIVSRDTNANGISDWEESLWGLDPSGDGPANKKSIDEKKAAAAVTPIDETADLTATDKFSQQILSTILALRQSGSLTPEVIAKVAASVGDSVDANHSSAVTYTQKDLTLSTKSPIPARDAYKLALKSVIGQYDSIDLGSELTIMSSGLENGSADTLKQLDPLAQAYIQLSRQIIELKTPSAVAQNALDLANASAQMGHALMQVENIYSDALTGMVGVGDYTKASNLADRASATLAAYFGN